MRLNYGWNNEARAAHECALRARRADYYSSARRIVSTRRVIAGLPAPAMGHKRERRRTMRTLPASLERFRSLLLGSFRIKAARACVKHRFDEGVHHIHHAGGVVLRQLCEGAWPAFRARLFRKPLHLNVHRRPFDKPLNAVSRRS